MSPATVVDDWPMLGKSPARLGYSPHSLQFPLVVKWTRKLPSATVSEAVVVGDTIYVATHHRLYAIHLDNGEIEWEFSPAREAGMSREQNAIHATPAILEGLICFADDMGIVYGLERFTGELIWKRDDLGQRNESVLAYNHAFFSKFFTRESNGLGARQGYVCLDVDGNTRWESASEDLVFTLHAAASDDKVFFGDRDGNAYAVSALDGHLEWRTNVKDAATSHLLASIDKPMIHGPPMVCDGKFVARFGHARILVAFSIEGGELSWAYEADRIISCPATEGRRIYYTTFGGGLYMVDGETGVEEKTFDYEGPDLGDIFSTRGLLLDGTYMAGYNSTRLLLAFSTHDGSLVWRHKGKAGFSASPIYSQGRLVIGDNQGNLTCFSQRET